MVFCFENCSNIAWGKKSVPVRKLKVINQQENPKFRFRAQYLSYIQSLKFFYPLAIDPEYTYLVYSTFEKLSPNLKKKEK